MHKGLVHAFAVNKEYTESHALLSKTFPIIPGGDRVVNAIDPQGAAFSLHARKAQ